MRHESMRKTQGARRSCGDRSLWRGVSHGVLRRGSEAVRHIDLDDACLKAAARAHLVNPALERPTGAIAKGTVARDPILSGTVLPEAAIHFDYGLA
jgi:hypothetical protein